MGTTIDHLHVGSGSWPGTDLDGLGGSCPGSAGGRPDRRTAMRGTGIEWLVRGEDEIRGGDVRPEWIDSRVGVDRARRGPHPSELEGDPAIVHKAPVLVGCWSLHGLVVIAIEGCAVVVRAGHED